VSRPPCLLPSPVVYAHASRSMHNPLSLRAHARNRQGTWFRSMHRPLSLRASARGGRVRCSKSTHQSNSGPYSDPAKEELIEVFLFLLSFLFYFLVPSYICSLIVFLSTLQFAESLLSCRIHFFLDLSARTEVGSLPLLRLWQWLDLLNRKITIIGFFLQCRFI
jgi:hypothetical protein